MFRKIVNTYFPGLGGNPLKTIIYTALKPEIWDPLTARVLPGSGVVTKYITMFTQWYIFVKCAKVSYCNHTRGTFQKQEAKPFPPLMSLQRPLLTKFSIASAGKGTLYRGPSSIFLEQAMKLEVRRNKLKTSTVNPCLLSFYRHSYLHPCLNCCTSTKQLHYFHLKRAFVCKNSPLPSLK